MVYADNSTQTRCRHGSRKQAEDEARRLAGINPGIKFFVLQSIGYAARTEPVEWVEHDGIPF